MWWDSMTTLQQAVFVIACAATAVLVIQLVMMLIGGHTDADISGGGMSDLDVPDGGISDIDVPDGGMTDADFSGGGALDHGGFDSDTDISGSSDGDGSSSDGETFKPFGLRLLSLRSIIAFLAVGGWVCYTLCYFMPWYGAAPIAAVCGFAAACGMAAALIGIEKMQDNGNIDPKNAIGKTGTVYLTVPAARSGRGKVNILIQERYAEYEAITNDSAPLPTASEIKVVGYDGGNVLVVERYKKPSITIENV